MTETNRTLSYDMIEKLKVSARVKTAEDTVEEGEYFNPSEASGGNFDDAYDIGLTAGEVYLAREILDSLGIAWAV